MSTSPKIFSLPAVSSGPYIARKKYGRQGLVALKIGKKMPRTNECTLISFPSADSQQVRNHADFWFNYGYQKEDAGRSREAVRAYRRAIELVPSHKSSWLNLGIIFHERKKLRAAELCYEKARCASPGCSLLYYNLGCLYDDLADNETNQNPAMSRVFRRKAFDAYTHALEIDPDYADAHYNLALHLTYQESLAAYPHWKAYLRSDPSSRWARRARAFLNKMRSRCVLMHTS